MDHHDNMERGGCHTSAAGTGHHHHHHGDLPAGWVNTDTIRSQLTLRFAGHAAHAGDTVKSVQGLPRGEDGFIHKQASLVALEPEHLIGQWESTAIAGNDVLSSCLFSVGLVTEVSGCLSPLANVVVSMVLYLFRRIYSMGVLTFPYNGGSYNLLGNVAPKPVAALGACFSIVAYIATAVVSAVSACIYLEQMLPVIPPLLGAVVLMVIFALLTLTGLKESTVVAMSIFYFHLATLALLCVGCLALAISQRFEILFENFANPLPPAYAGDNLALGYTKAMFYGVSIAMLGVTGFETGAQFVESMKEGVFCQTLRNLWASSAILNTLLSFLAISILPMDEILHNRDTVLSHMMHNFAAWVFGAKSPMVKVMIGLIAFDAFIVLSGAVLTAFVGVDGLLYQLAIDKSMPAFLTRKNKCRGTNHYIILVFLALCILLVEACRGNVVDLAGVFSISFLCVMSCFGFGAMLLKLSPIYSPVIRIEGRMLPWWYLVTAVGAVLVTLVGNLMANVVALRSFVYYLVPIYMLCMACTYSDRFPAPCQKIPKLGRGQSIEIERRAGAVKKMDGSPVSNGLHRSNTAGLSPGGSEVDRENKEEA